MFLGALLDAGLSRKTLAADLAGLGVDHRLVVSRVKRGVLGARFVDVRVPGARGGRDADASVRGTRRGRDADASVRGTRRGRDADASVRGARRGRDEKKPKKRKHAHHHGRHYSEIVRILEKARLVASVRERALAIFRALAEAEAAVHGTPLAKVHFHEVGAVDALVDVAGAAIALERLEVERVTCSPLALGHGTVQTEHGLLPLPAPATLELLRGIPTVPAGVGWETVTPTGAAIVRTVVDAFRPLPALIPESIGHGAGLDREGPMPNVLRAVLGRDGGPAWDRVLVLETHLDDLIPEHFDHLMDRLLEAGALDVALQHLQGKKNRPGFAVRVLGRPADREALAGVLFAESSALGVRVAEWDRLVLPREVVRVKTDYGRIAVKWSRDPDGGVEVSAEYDDCKRAARRHGVPLRRVVRAAEDAARRAKPGSD